MRFKRITRGLYINHAYNFTISHETAWRPAEGRKWRAEWRGYSVRGLVSSPATERRSCESMAEAREWCEKFVAAHSLVPAKGSNR